jgi:hypothetical protein
MTTTGIKINEKELNERAEFYDWINKNRGDDLLELAYLNWKKSAAEIEELRAIAQDVVNEFYNEDKKTFDDMAPIIELLEAALNDERKHRS